MVKTAGRAKEKSGTVMPRISLHLLTLGMFAVCFLTWNVWSSYWDFRAARTQTARLDEMIKQITEADQFMTTFARLGASFGDTRWEEHYYAATLQRERLLTKMGRLSPKVFSSAEAMEMNTLKMAVTAQETKALEYVRAKKTDLADPVAFGEAYEKDKELYLEKFQQVVEELRKNLAYDLTSYRQKALTAVVWGACLLPFFAILHLVLVKLLGRFYANREQVLLNE